MVCVRDANASRSIGAGAPIEIQGDALFVPRGAVHRFDNLSCR